MKEKNFGKGCLIEPIDSRDLTFEEALDEEVTVDWDKGYNVEDEVGFKLPFKNQGETSSCVGQAVSYYTPILRILGIKDYVEASAKSIYSQIYLDCGGAYIRDGMSLVVNWGILKEKTLPSYDNGELPSEEFMRETDWLNEEMTARAEDLQYKEYRVIRNSDDMDIFAHAIKQGKGVVTGVNGSNNGSWDTLEPKPPQKKEWGHALFFGAFGRDDKGRYIATPNSWGDRFNGKWQKFRKEWFNSGNLFNPRVFINKPINMELEDDTLVFKSEGRGKNFGVVVDGKLLIGKSADVIGVFLMRNKGNIKGKTRTLTREQWNSLKHYNLKKELINK